MLTLTFLAGLFQLVMGLARLGVLVNFISHTVVSASPPAPACSSRAASSSTSSGLDRARGSLLHEVVRQAAIHLGDANPYVTAVGGATLPTGIALRRLLPKCRT